MSVFISAMVTIASNIGGVAFDTLKLDGLLWFRRLGGLGAALWLHRNKTKENELCFRKRQKNSRNQRNCAYTTVNSLKSAVIVLWLLFICPGFVFAVYKNFTAVDTHTVHEKKSLSAA